MAPLSVAPCTPHSCAVADRRVRQLLSALFHTETQVPALVSATANKPSSWTAIAEHARSVGPYLVDLCAARQLNVKDVPSVSLSSSSSPFDVLQREVDLVRRLGEVADDAGDTGLRQFCEGWLRARSPHVGA